MFARYINFAIIFHSYVALGTQKPIVSKEQLEKRSKKNIREEGFPLETKRKSDGLTGMTQSICLGENLAWIVHVNLPDLTAESNLRKKKGMVLPFEPHCMCFTDINYHVDVPLVCAYNSLYYYVILGMNDLLLFAGAQKARL